MKNSKWSFLVFWIISAHATQRPNFKVLWHKGRGLPPIRIGCSTTELHLAATINDVSIILQLLKEGANPNALDDRGKRPWELAEDQRIKYFLKEAADMHLYSNRIARKKL